MINKPITTKSDFVFLSNIEIEQDSIVLEALGHSSDIYSNIIVTDSIWFFTKNNSIFSYNLQNKEFKLFETLGFHNISFGIDGILDIFKSSSGIIAIGELAYQKSDHNFNFKDTQVFVWGGRMYKEFNKYKTEELFVDAQSRFLFTYPQDENCKIHKSDIFIIFSLMSELGSLTIEKNTPDTSYSKNIAMPNSKIGNSEYLNRYLDLDVIYLDTAIAKVILKTRGFDPEPDVIITLNHNTCEILDEKPILGLNGLNIVEGNPLVCITGKSYTYHSGYLYRLSNTLKGAYVEWWKV